MSTLFSNIEFFVFCIFPIANRIRFRHKQYNETQNGTQKMEYTFAEHVALIMQERGVDQNKAKMMAWIEGPRKKEESKNA